MDAFWTENIQFYIVFPAESEIEPPVVDKFGSVYVYLQFDNESLRNEHVYSQKGA